MMIRLQLWEQFFSDGSIQSDGCSLHIDKKSRDEYIKENYLNINERPVGLETEVEVSDEILSVVENNKNIRLSEVELNNLIGLKDIKPL